MLTFWSDQQKRKTKTKTKIKNLSFSLNLWMNLRFHNNDNITNDNRTNFFCQINFFFFTLLYFTVHKFFIYSFKFFSIYSCLYDNCDCHFFFYPFHTFINDKLIWIEMGKIYFFHYQNTGFVERKRLDPRELIFFFVTSSTYLPIVDIWYYECINKKDIYGCQWSS